MPTQKGKGSGSPTKRAHMAPVRFINQDLTAEQQRELKNQEFGSSEFEDSVCRLYEQGYKLTCSYDDFQGCYAAWIVPKGVEHKNAGLILSGRGSSPLKAIKQVLFKHYAIFDGDVWDLGNQWGAAILDD